MGRPKHEVAKELPLTTKIIECDLNKVQKNKYKEALEGLLEVVDKETGEVTEKEVSKLTAVTICQQIVNHPALVDCDGDSNKLESLLDLLTNELEGEKVIIFSRLRQMVDIMEAEIEAKGSRPVVSQVQRTATRGSKAKRRSKTLMTRLKSVLSQWRLLKV